MNSPAGAVEGPSSRDVDFSRRRKITLLAVVAVVVAGVAGSWYWNRESDIEAARRALKANEWEQARRHLRRHLDRHPESAEGHLLMAEAYAKADSGDSAEFIDRAIEHLRQVPDDSPLAARARLQQARLTLLIKRKAGRAERLLRESLKRGPDSYEANLLMWKLLDLTGRHIHSGEYFWRVYERSHPTKRPSRLRDWFFAEFFPDLANAPYYLALGVKPSDGKTPTSFDLLTSLRRQEPEAPFLHAALATHYRELGRPKRSLEVLKEAPDLSRAMRDSFFVAALFEALIDLGEFQTAKACFAQWPSPREGYLFLRCQGKYRQYVLQDAVAAVESYRRALEYWPAKFDWSLMMRLSECLRKTGRVKEAERIRARVDDLTTRVMTHESTTALRVGINDLQNVSAVKQMRDLYREFGLTREANAWNEHLRTLLPTEGDRKGPPG